MTLVEDLRLGGTGDSAHGNFGSVQTIAEDAAGGVYVFDSQVPSLTYFDSTGRYVRTIGHEGSGPGEYRQAIAGMAVRRDGRLILRDTYNGRLTLYDADGSAVDHWPLGSALSAPRSLVLDTADHVFLTILLHDPQPMAQWEFGLLHLDSGGQFVDSLQAPSVSEEVLTRPSPFRTAKIWGFSPRRYFAVGMNDHYQFEIVGPTGTRIRVERAVANVPVNEEERAEWEGLLGWARARLPADQAAALPSIPELKPAYKVLTFGKDHRVWVLRYVPALRDTTLRSARKANQPPPITWREPEVWDVFEDTGEYLGEVLAPLATSLVLFGRDRVWGVQDDGEWSHLVRYRLRPSREAVIH